MIYQHNEICKTIVVPCTCFTETMEISRWDWSDSVDYGISFRVDCFSVKRGIFSQLKERLRFAWLALTKGSYIFEDIVVTREILKELQQDIDIILEKEPDADYGYKVTTI